ncbi:inositol monophosphatase family protein [Kiritimatiellaeota bacterium B1221]|nr:inositol monophosphatase family protein [Kiritimatiellaeota bacterium B1221]
MKLSTENLLLLSELALSVAEQAAEKIAETSPESLEVECKAGAVSRASEVVSQLDRDVEGLILEGLSGSIDDYDLGVLAEESEDSQARFEKSYFWCVDPLDGTLPFLEGKPGYAVSIALIDREGTPWIGVGVDPRRGDKFRGVRGAGVQLNGRDFSGEAGNEKLAVLTDRSMAKHPLFQSCLEALAPTQIFPPAGAVMNVLNMLREAPACYFKFPKPELGGGSIWDYAATACICTEAGGVVTDLFGDPLDLNRKDSTFMNHRGFVYATDPELHARVRGEVEKIWTGASGE